MRLWCICVAFMIHLWCVYDAFVIFCDAFAIHLWCICDLFVMRLRCICDAFAIHLRCICDAFVMHLWEYGLGVQGLKISKNLCRETKKNSDFKSLPLKINLLGVLEVLYYLHAVKTSPQKPRSRGQPLVWPFFTMPEIPPPKGYLKPSQCWHKVENFTYF